MKAILVLELADDVNLNEIEIRYLILNKYGMVIKADADGCPIKPMPSKKQIEERWHSEDYSIGWNDCIEEIEK